MEGKYFGVQVSGFRDYDGLGFSVRESKDVSLSSLPFGSGRTWQLT